MPDDPWRPGDLDVLYEGFGIAAALDAFEDDPAELAPALATLSCDDCRAALFALVMQEWVDRADRSREGLLLRLTRRFRHAVWRDR